MTTDASGPPTRSFEVRSGDVTLAVRERAAEGAHTVLLLHGFPDTQAMWDPVAQLLNTTHRLRVITYDIRGMGDSTAPAGRSGYRLECLVDDLVAVMDTVNPDGPVHLVGHDWGSVQFWEAAANERTDPRLSGRIPSFTSISGPSLSYVSYALDRARRARDFKLFASQGRRTWYVYAFQIPWLPELAVRGLSGPIRSMLTRTQRLGEGHWAGSFDEDAAHGLNLYRANIGRLAKRGAAGTEVPMQLLVPEFEPFIDARLYEWLPEVVTNLTRVDVRAGHWVPRTDPALVAGLVADHVKAHA